MASRQDATSSEVFQRCASFNERALIILLNAVVAEFERNANNRSST